MRTIRTPLACLGALTFACLGAAGCTIQHEHTVDAHVRLDVNLRVQRELDDFFGGIEEEVKQDAGTPGADD